MYIHTYSKEMSSNTGTGRQTGFSSRRQGKEMCFRYLPGCIHLRMRNG